MKKESEKFNKGDSIFFVYIDIDTDGWYFYTVVPGVVLDTNFRSGWNTFHNLEHSLHGTRTSNYINSSNCFHKREDAIKAAKEKINPILQSLYSQRDSLSDDKDYELKTDLQISIFKHLANLESLKE